MDNLEKINNYLSVNDLRNSIICLNHLVSLVQNNRDLVNEDAKERLKTDILGETGLANSLLGHIIRKPHGYAGDYEIIEKIYTYHTSSDPRIQILDKHIQLLPTSSAVRNRISFFMEVCSKIIFSSTDKDLNILNLGSGPGRELNYFLSSKLSKSKNIKIDCVDMDEKSIEYNSMINSKFTDKLNFIHRNVLKFRTKEQYDLIWSSGLFDYLEDKTFIWLLNRLKKNLKTNGTIVIGNFNKSYNPIRGYMEEIADWFLIHRTRTELTQLAKQVFPTSKITVKAEAENINLFLVIG